MFFIRSPQALLLGREERGAAMADQVIDAAMARGLHADACRAHAVVGWVVMRNPPEYPDRVIAAW